MSIQIQKSKDKGIDFFAVIEDIKMDENDTWNSANKVIERVSKYSKIRMDKKVTKNKEQRSSMVNCDKQRMMQVLLGLQSNALKFTQEGSVQVHLKIIEVSGREYLQVSVIDSGIGIEPQD